MGPIIDSDDPEPAAFKKRGGKLIQYHGWNDAAIRPRSSILYSERWLRRRPGDQPPCFYGLYLVSGMLHCGGGMGPATSMAAELVRWVDCGKGPAGLTATSAANVAAQLLSAPIRAWRRKGRQGRWNCRVNKKGLSLRTNRGRAG
jgi:feruloyl esterase